ncbi:MAG: tetratricopeptide repeat protein [Chloroflexota bacterium]|nr:tetratricopeptide repeat protein [Chloroflexota bacterium]
MNVSRTQLLSRKRDLFGALHVLERDFRDGVIDEEAYRAAVDRYETEAARILEQLDEMPVEAEGRPQPVGATAMKRAFAVGAVGLVLAVIVFLLLAATHHRLGNETITGSGGGPGATAPSGTSPAVHAAEAVVLRHPHSAGAWVGLGNAYLNSGDLTSANGSYLAAIRLAPASPAPRVLHAMVLGMAGRPAAARTTLRQVERAHPSYARAWLLDGLYAPPGRPGYPYAIRAWNRFLALQPSGPMAISVRHWIAVARKSEGVKKP